SKTENARNYRGDPPGTSRTSAGALHRRRFTLDRSDDPRIVEPGDRANTNDLDLDGTDLSSAFPACLASPVVSHRNDVEPLSTASGGTHGNTHRRRQGSPNTGAHTD